METPHHKCSSLLLNVNVLLCVYRIRRRQLFKQCQVTGCFIWQRYRKKKEDRLKGVALPQRHFWWSFHANGHNFFFKCTQREDVGWTFSETRLRYSFSTNMLASYKHKEKKETRSSLVSLWLPGDRLGIPY